MPRQSPIPEPLDREFYAAANDERLVLQHCARCDRWQYPPEPVCAECARADTLAWRETDGRGTIHSFAVIHDTQVASLRPDLPYTVAVIGLDACPGIVMLSQLPGTESDDVRIGRPVRLTFLTTEATGQKVPEWEVVA
ncbi:OB-fold domain-containing protein [Nocardia sp. BSTN01]|uniref:Zn-ribbon domain-containing OB-fold protein n=1 Tax=Nocardia sp. BSTN01 TaxID=2783665 RepID=UPI0018909374|nr:OB-fold domain-containing protein [Nocardia sp. BSTN01]MBF4999657.1 OB-fold domain-containing protein [Nocardia sp. BSTN01]